MQHTYVPSVSSGNFYGTVSQGSSGVTIDSPSLFSGTPVGDSVIRVTVTAELIHPTDGVYEINTAFFFITVQDIDHCNSLYWNS